MANNKEKFVHHDESEHADGPLAAVQEDAVEVLAGEHHRLQSLFSWPLSCHEDRPAVLNHQMRRLANRLDMEKQMRAFRSHATAGAGPMSCQSCDKLVAEDEGAVESKPGRATVKP